MTGKAAARKPASKPASPRKRRPLGLDGPGELTPELVPIASLKLDRGNARRHSNASIEALKASLREFGQRKPIVTSRARTLVAGEGTVRAAEELGWTEVWATVFPGTATQARAYAIADNHSADLSTWDNQQLADTLVALREQDEDLFAAISYPDANLSALLAKLGTPELPAEPPSGDEDEVVAARYAERVKYPRTHTGDMWHLGRHRVVCGDSFRAETLDALLGSERRVDCVLTDPPYAIYGSSSGIGADIADDRMVRPFFEALIRLIGARLRVFGHAYVHCDWRSWAALQDGARVAGVSVKNMIVWDKQSQGMGNMYAHTHELIAFLVPEPPPKAMASGRRSGHRTVLKSNIVRHARVTGKDREHNAAKPVPLLAEFIANSTDAGQTVLDLFAGSGSVLMACEQTDRVCLSSEQDPRWCDVIAARWQRATDRLPELHRGDEKPRSVDLSKPLTAPE